MKTQTASLTIALILSALSQPGNVDGVHEEKRCGSVDIRNNPRMAFQPRQQFDNPTGRGSNITLKYKECTILEGDLSLSMITQPNTSEEDYPVFENLREITGSILVFQIRGLRSLGHMFPNLRVIGGHTLIMNYALVIYQNQDLRSVGLNKLEVIKNGGVRITENPRLCYARTVDWEVLLKGSVRDLIIDQVAGNCGTECEEDDATSQERSCHRAQDGEKHCWDPVHCQRACKEESYPGSGCTDSGEACHELCLGGCYSPGDSASCHTCRFTDVDGLCVRHCPLDMYEQLGRRCLTKRQCHSLYPVAGPGRNEKSEWKAFKGQCIYECPSNYQEDPADPHECVKCEGYCPKKCQGDTVDSIGSAMKFASCNIVEGNLELDMRIGMESTGAEKFSEAFGEIEEITGYLLIRFSSAFMSLHMFKTLRAIHGKQLWKNAYALVVFENQNLHQLFNIDRHPLQILNGRVTFQNNRMLCYKKIEAFMEQIGMKESMTENDISPYSNGDKAICDEIPLEVKIVSVQDSWFVVSWVPFNTSDLDHRKFLGYQIFYKKVEREDPNMSIDDDRSACADSWTMQFVTDPGDGDILEDPQQKGLQKEEKQLVTGEIISQGVKPNTLYAVYVQTRLVNHPGARNAISRIHFVKTTFGYPDPPRMRDSYALGADKLRLSWDPPLEAHGVITHYMVNWNLVVDRPPSSSVDYCTKRPPMAAATRSGNGPASPLVSHTGFSTKEEGTCQRQKGCCECAEQQPTGAKNLMAEEGRRGESALFENSLQNAIFVQQQQPQTTSVVAIGAESASTGTSAESPNGGRRKRRRRAPGMRSSSVERSTDQLTVVEHLDVSASPNGVSNETSGRINVTGESLILTGLPHFAEYQITIYACQDVAALEHYCSTIPAWTSVRTLPIAHYDMVDASTVVLRNTTEEADGEPEEDGNNRLVHWQPPPSPNGHVVAYRVRLIRDGSTLVERCITYGEFEEKGGLEFLDLPNGIYDLEIRVETTSFHHGQNVTLVPAIFEIYMPGFFTTRNIVIISLVFLLAFSAIGMTLYYYINRMFGKKFDDYCRQTISANPDYLSQLEIYKADEWELRREDLDLKEEIGRGTFGKVLRGHAKDIRSVTGQVFGECAVKTVPEGSSNAERLHFLIEASVMKQFNTAFIVKLYGVVSDGQPVLVVMEMMGKGNLRDFLRSHRPGAEENTEGRGVPTLLQYFTWAAQIADGMAYLESLRFCHRDLAARNCMVHDNESVKIGDFGMARDIYYHEYYKPTGKRLMPVKWMAPESLKDGRFTLKSDVWSFGIVLYEMLTLGQQPYAGLANNQVFNFVGVQRRMIRQPKGCPDYWYKLMRVCWRYDSRERPSFHQIVKYIAEHATDEFRELSFVLHDPRYGIGGECNEIYNFDLDLALDQSHDGQNLYQPEDGDPNSEGEEDEDEEYEEDEELDELDGDEAEDEGHAEIGGAGLTEGGGDVHSAEDFRVKFCRDGIPSDNRAESTELDLESGGPVCSNNRRVLNDERRRSTSPMVTIHSPRSASSADLRENYE